MLIKRSHRFTIKYDVNTKNHVRFLSFSYLLRHLHRFFVLTCDFFLSNLNCEGRCEFNFWVVEQITSHEISCVFSLCWGKNSMIKTLTSLWNFIHKMFSICNRKKFSHHISLSYKKCCVEFSKIKIPLNFLQFCFRLFKTQSRVEFPFRGTKKRFVSFRPL